MGNHPEPDQPHTLCKAENGTPLKIKQIHDETPAGQRLREMGFCEMAEIHKVSDADALICSVCGAHLAVSREIAQKTIVEPIPKPAPPANP